MQHSISIKYTQERVHPFLIEWGCLTKHPENIDFTDIFRRFSGEKIGLGFFFKFRIYFPMFSSL